MTDFISFLPQELISEICWLLWQNEISQLYTNEWNLKLTCKSLFDTVTKYQSEFKTIAFSLDKYNFGKNKNQGGKAKGIERILSDFQSIRRVCSGLFVERNLQYRNRKIIVHRDSGRRQKPDRKFRSDFDDLDQRLQHRQAAYQKFAFHRGKAHLDSALMMNFCVSAILFIGLHSNS